MSVAQLETEFFPARANLRLLVLLRTSAIIVQVTAVVAAANAFDVPLPLGPMLGAIALLAIANGLTWIRLRQPRAASQAEIFGQILIDAAILAVLPCASSAIDPFSNCYLLLAMFAASALPERHARAPVAVCALCYTAFQLFYVPPLEAATAVRGIDLPVHWAIYMLLAPLIAWIAGRLNQVREEHSRIVQREAEKGARDHHVLGLAALAAGAAHEMNTPLSTMSVVVGDLRRNRTPPADWEKSVDMLWRQIQICRQSLAEMVNTAHAGESGDGRNVSPSRLMREVVDRFRLLRPEAALVLNRPGDDTGATLKADRTLSQALLNLLNNAADASPAPTAIELHALQGDSTFVLRILDRGSGIPSSVRERIGRRRVTTRDNGNGVGLLITHAVIDRFGGAIEILERNGGGTCVQVTLPVFRMNETEGDLDHVGAGTPTAVAR